MKLSTVGKGPKGSITSAITILCNTTSEMRYDGDEPVTHIQVT